MQSRKAQRPGTGPEIIRQSKMEHGPYSTKIHLRTIDDLAMRNLAGIRAKHWLETMVEQLGGPGAISLAKRTLLERAAFVRAMTEHMEAERLDGNEINVGSYSNLVSTLHNLLRTVGLEKIMKDVTPNLTAYLRSHDARGAEGGPGGEKRRKGGGDDELAYQNDHPLTPNHNLHPSTSTQVERRHEPLTITIPVTSSAERLAEMDEYYRRTHPTSEIDEP